MMKGLLLLVCFVFVSGTPVSDTNRTILRELVSELKAAKDAIPQTVKDSQGNTIYLKDLNQKYNTCKPEYFCEVEHELLKKVSSLSGPKFEHFRIDKVLMRNLNTYNKRPDEKTCHFDVTVTEEIPLHEFLNGFLACVRNIYSKNKQR